jgi:hypothetical protein
MQPYSKEKASTYVDINKEFRNKKYWNNFIAECT